MPDILGYSLAPEGDGWVAHTKLRFDSAAAAAAFLSDLAGAPPPAVRGFSLGDVHALPTEAKVAAQPVAEAHPELVKPAAKPAEVAKPKATKPALVKVPDPAPAPAPAPEPEPEPPAVVEVAKPEPAPAPEPEVALSPAVEEAAVEDEPEPEPDRAKPVRQPKPAGPDPQAVIDGLPEASFAGRLRPVALALKVAGVTAEQAEAVMLVEDNRKRMKSYADRADYPSIVAATVSAAWAASA